MDKKLIVEIATHLLKSNDLVFSVPMYRTKFFSALIKIKQSIESDKELENKKIISVDWMPINNGFLGVFMDALIGYIYE